MASLVAGEVASDDAPICQRCVVFEIVAVSPSLVECSPDAERVLHRAVRAQALLDQKARADIESIKVSPRYIVNIAMSNYGPGCPGWEDFPQTEVMSKKTKNTCIYIYFKSKLRHQNKKR